MKVIKFSTVPVLCLAVLATVACSSMNKSQSTGSLSPATTTMSSMNTSTKVVKHAHASIGSTKADTSGNGKVDFIQNNDGTVSMNLTLEFPKMANKSVAVHLHEHGDCGDEGKGAHGHWNPTNENHGKWGSAAFHSGDIGNVSLDGNGKGTFQLSTNRWSLGGNEKTNILNRAIIVHSGVDDYTSQPSGNAGSRIGCGIITAD